MILTLILSIVAGVAVPTMEPMVRNALKNVTLMDLAISDSQYDMLTLLLLLLVVVVVCAVFGIPTPAFLIVVGAIVGLFGKDLVAAARGDKSAGGPQ